MSKIRVLLLTNRDSDNVGDQIIEATAISLIECVMKNLDIPRDRFVISSRAAGIISRKYMQTEDPQLLEGARKAISAADVIIFGGAPLFNYKYQLFYKRTIKTLELAEEYGVPVLFSSIGVEPFDAENPKSIALKSALNLPCVRQVTTRDDFESLQKYMDGTNTPVAQVADPAVFADIVFRKILPEGRPIRRRQSTGAPPVNSSGSTPDLPNRRKIGLVVTRGGIFKDNSIKFSEDDQRKFWLSVIDLLSERGYDYKLFTTGHFSDEVFLDTLVRDHGIPSQHATVTVNSPEQLINELNSCDGVIAYRLHASITSFALNVPSVGLSWNFKVPYFYDLIGYGERALSHEHWTAPEAVFAIERAMDEGIKKDEDFLMTVYETLFAGLKGVFACNSDREPFTYQQLELELPAYAGTSQKLYDGKMRRKLRRTYQSYQDRVRDAARTVELSKVQSTEDDPIEGADSYRKERDYFRKERDLFRKERDAYRKQQHLLMAEVESKTKDIRSVRNELDLLRKELTKLRGENKSLRIRLDRYQPSTDAAARENASKAASAFTTHNLIRAVSIRLRHRARSRKSMNVL